MSAVFLYLISQTHICQRQWQMQSASVSTAVSAILGLSPRKCQSITVANECEMRAKLIDFTPDRVECTRRMLWVFMGNLSISNNLKNVHSPLFKVKTFTKNKMQSAPHKKQKLKTTTNNQTVCRHITISETTCQFAADWVTPGRGMGPQYVHGIRKPSEYINIYK